MSKRCMSCDKLTHQRQNDATIKVVCGITKEPKWLTDSCGNWRKKIEVYECRDEGESAIDLRV